VQFPDRKSETSQTTSLSPSPAVILINPHYTLQYAQSHPHACQFCTVQTGVFWISEIKLNFSNPPESTDNHVAVVGGEFFAYVYFYVFYTSLSHCAVPSLFVIFARTPGSHWLYLRSSETKTFNPPRLKIARPNRHLQQTCVYFCAFSSSLCTH